MIETLGIGSILVLFILFAYKNRFQESYTNDTDKNKSNNKFRGKISRYELMSALRNKNYNVLEEIIRRCKKGGDDFSFIDNLSDEIKSDEAFLDKLKNIFGEEETFICNGYRSSRERYTWECVIYETSYEVWFIDGKFVEKNHSKTTRIKEYD